MRPLVGSQWWLCTVWAMMPLAVLAGVPTSRCLCAASERPAACQCLCCCGKPVAEGSSSGNCCGMCGKGHHDSIPNDRPPISVPTKPKLACCPSERVTPNAGESRCCGEVAAEPCIVPVAVAVPDTSEVNFGLTVETVETAPPFHSSAAIDIGHLHVGPSADLVVCLRAFLI